jgi:hypothetical protein
MEKRLAAPSIFRIRLDGISIVAQRITVQRASLF